MSASSDLAPHKRSYAQLCPLARALDAVGERWTLLIVRNLLVGPMRYGQLQEALPGVTTNLLAKRLKELCARALLEPRLVHGVTVYGLTRRGFGLEPALLALAAWGEAEPMPPAGQRNLRWAMLGLRRRYRGGVSGTARIVCRQPNREFLLRFGEQLEFCEALQGAPDVVAEGTEASFFAAIYGRAPWRELVRQGALSLSGDRKLFGAMLKSCAP